MRFIAIKIDIFDQAMSLIPGFIFTYKSLPQARLDLLDFRSSYSGFPLHDSALNSELLAEWAKLATEAAPPAAPLAAPEPKTFLGFAARRASADTLVRFLNGLLSAASAYVGVHASQVPACAFMGLGGSLASPFAV